MRNKKVLYRGSWYPVDIKIDKNRRRARVELGEEKFCIDTPSSEETWIREALERWFIRQAHMIFPVRVMYFQQKTGGVVNEIHIKDQKTRWGSCSSRRNLNFNWNLIMAPPSVLDYVVVHELCHLTHMNHSRDFWNLVEHVMPEYQQVKNWLRENGALLHL